MMRRIEGQDFGHEAAFLRIVDTREKAREQESFFHQLINLYQQLTDRVPAKNLPQLVGNNFHFIFVTQGTNLLATASVALIRASTVCFGHVIDLVVDDRYRKMKLGDTILDEAIRLGRERGCEYLELTSKPRKPGTSSFCPKSGFELMAIARDDHPQATHLYRCYL